MKGIATVLLYPPYTRTYILRVEDTYPPILHLSTCHQDHLDKRGMKRGKGFELRDGRNRVKRRCRKLSHPLLSQSWPWPQIPRPGARSPSRYEVEVLVWQCRPAFHLCPIKVDFTTSSSLSPTKLPLCRLPAWPGWSCHWCSHHAPPPGAGRGLHESCHLPSEVRKRGWGWWGHQEASWMQASSKKGISPVCPAICIHGQCGRWGVRSEHHNTLGGKGPEYSDDTNSQQCLNCHMGLGELVQKLFTSCQLTWKHIFIAVLPYVLWSTASISGKYMVSRPGGWASSDVLEGGRMAREEEKDQIRSWDTKAHILI